MEIKFLSWNIWCGTYFEDVKKFIKESDADVIALQEIVNNIDGNMSEIIAKELGYNFIYTSDIDMPLKYLPGYQNDNENTIKMGNAILSRYEILSSQEHILIEGQKRTVIEASIEIKDKILKVFSVHLRHTHQTQSSLQSSQLESLLKLLPNTNTIVMGDFNSLPESKIISRTNEYLTNTDMGLNTPTWSVYKEGCTECLIEDIVYKLDYIFTTRDINTHSFKVHASKASDHLPISVLVSI